jgi:hypothetical protein
LAGTDTDEAPLRSNCPQFNTIHSTQTASTAALKCDNTQSTVWKSDFGVPVVSMLASGTFGGLVVSMLPSGTFGVLVVSMLPSGTFGGLVVSMLLSGTQDRGFAPGRSRRIYRAIEFSACLPSEGK